LPEKLGKGSLGGSVTPGVGMDLPTFAFPLNIECHMTLQEETDLLKSVTDLKALINGIDGRLKKLEAIGPPDYEQNRRTRFQENGSWARHYSTVRMTTTTFLVPVSLGILSFKWNGPQHPQIRFIALSGVVWVLAVLLFLLFTRLTYGEMERARLKRKDMPDGGTGRGDENNPFHPRQDVASWILALLTLFYGVLLVCLGDIRVWPPYFVLTSSSLMKSAACAVPVCVVVMGLVAILLTALQAAFSKASAP